MKTNLEKSLLLVQTVTHEAVDSVNAGQLSATVAQDPAGIGAKGLELLVEAVKAGNIGEVGVVPDMTPVDSVLVTKE